MYVFASDMATTEIYTLSLHDALPICRGEGEEGLAVVERADGDVDRAVLRAGQAVPVLPAVFGGEDALGGRGESALPVERSEEHTSELQSQSNLVCRLLLEKKKSP